jgi:hypothetical protein
MTYRSQQFKPRLHECSRNFGLRTYTSPRRGAGFGGRDKGLFEGLFRRGSRPPVYVWQFAIRASRGVSLRARSLGVIETVYEDVAMRMIPLHAVVFVLVVFATAVRAQTQPPPLTGEPYRDADPFASARIAALRKQVDAKTPGAVDRFWSDVRTSGAPLVEPVPTEKNYSFVTFVWRGSDAAHNVVVVDGVAVAVGGVLPVNSEATRLDGTDVWYRTYKVRNDARFAYKLSENDPLTSFVDPNRKSNATIDPLNPRVFPTQQSFVELPYAASQEIALHPSDTPGKVEQKKFHSTTLNNDRDLWILHAARFSRGRRTVSAGGCT